jgi:MFS family permease
MISCDLGRLVVFALVAAVVPPLPALVALVAVASVLATLFRPAGSSLVPRLVAPAELLAANAWIGTGLNLQVVLGPPLGGLAFQTIGIRGALALDAASFLASALLVVRLPAEDAPAEERAGLAADLREGLAFVWRDPVLRVVVVTLFLTVLFAAVDNVALVFLTRDRLHASALGYAAAAAAFGVGMVAVSVTLTRLGRAVSPFGVYLAGQLTCGVGTLATGLAPDVAVAAAMQAVAGAGNGADNIGADTVVQGRTPPRLLGRAFGLVGTIAVLGSSLASLLASALVDVASPRTAFLVGGAGVVATMLPVVAIAARAR